MAGRNVERRARGYGARMRSRPCVDRAEYELRQRAKAAVAAWTASANALLAADSPNGIEIPAVRFDLRGRAAGMTVFGGAPRARALIRLNADLLVTDAADMIEETVPHEVAHVAARWLHGERIKPHGPEWRTVMQAFGKPPTACHALPAAPARRVRYYPYACACPRPVYLSAIRHGRARKGRQHYRCTRCGRDLRYTGEPPRRGHPSDTG